MERRVEGMQESPVLVADRYRFEPNGNPLHDRLVRDLRIEWRGETGWTVSYNGTVLNRFGQMEYEPLPSSRTDEFIERTRYSLEEAERLARTFILSETGG